LLDDLPGFIESLVMLDERSSLLDADIAASVGDVVRCSCMSLCDGIDTPRYHYLLARRTRELLLNRTNGNSSLLHSFLVNDRSAN
jgi:hypothetical protein